MGDIDSSFVQSPDHRPQKPKVDADAVAIQIPVIDLSGGDTGEIVSKVGSACKNWGFFQIINYGMPVELHKKIDAVTRKFFKQSTEEKMKVKRDEVNPLGYHDGEHTKNVRDWKETYGYLLKETIEYPASPDPEDDGVNIISNRWPECPSEFREVLEEYGREVEKLSYKLMELIALSLGLAPQTFEGYFQEKQLSILRLNYYPPCPFPHLALGVGRHRDSGALTLLAQDDVIGLEVKRKSDGEWLPIKPVPYAIIVNIGDILQVWSNDKYESVEHRAVVNSEKERISLPFFFFPARTVMLKPLEELINKDNPPKYSEYSWGKFYAHRAYGEFKKRNVENIQISNFKIDYE